MRNGSLIFVGAGIFILGILIKSDLVDALLNLVGWLTMVAGIAVFASGVFFAVRAKQ